MVSIDGAAESSSAYAAYPAQKAAARGPASRAGCRLRGLIRISRIRPQASRLISGRMADSSVVASRYPKVAGVTASVANAAGSCTRSAAAAGNPSTNPESPPSAALRRQCGNCTVGTGSRYGLSVCGGTGRLVKARLDGEFSTRTSNSRP
jgi:hypothetical protein